PPSNLSSLSTLLSSTLSPAKSEQWIPLAPLVVDARGTGYLAVQGATSLSIKIVSLPYPTSAANATQPTIGRVFDTNLSAHIYSFTTSSGRFAYLSLGGPSADVLFLLIGSDSTAIITLSAFAFSIADGSSRGTLTLRALENGEFNPIMTDDGTAAYFVVAAPDLSPCVQILDLTANPIKSTCASLGLPQGTPNNAIKLSLTGNGNLLISANGVGAVSLPASLPLPMNAALTTLPGKLSTLRALPDNPNAVLAVDFTTGHAGLFNASASPWSKVWTASLPTNSIVVAVDSTRGWAFVCSGVAGDAQADEGYLFAIRTLDGRVAWDPTMTVACSKDAVAVRPAEGTVLVTSQFGTASLYKVDAGGATTTKVWSVPLPSFAANLAVPVMPPAVWAAGDGDQGSIFFGTSSFAFNVGKAPIASSSSASTASATETMATGTGSVTNMPAVNGNSDPGTISTGILALILIIAILMFVVALTFLLCWMRKRRNRDVEKPLANPPVIAVPPVVAAPGRSARAAGAVAMSSAVPAASPARGRQSSDDGSFESAGTPSWYEEPVGPAAERRRSAATAISETTTIRSPHNASATTLRPPIPVIPETAGSPGRPSPNPTAHSSPRTIREADAAGLRTPRPIPLMSVPVEDDIRTTTPRLAGAMSSTASTSLSRTDTMRRIHDRKGDDARVLAGTADRLEAVLAAAAAAKDGEGMHEGKSTLNRGHHFGSAALAVHPNTHFLVSGETPTPMAANRHPNLDHEAPDAPTDNVRPLSSISTDTAILRSSPRPAAGSLSPSPELPRAFSPTSFSSVASSGGYAASVSSTATHRQNSRGRGNGGSRAARQQQRLGATSPRSSRSSLDGAGSIMSSRSSRGSEIWEAPAGALPVVPLPLWREGLIADDDLDGDDDEDAWRDVVMAGRGMKRVGTTGNSFRTATDGGESFVTVPEAGSSSGRGPSAGGVRGGGGTETDGYMTAQSSIRSRTTGAEVSGEGGGYATAKESIDSEGEGFVTGRED
ncbi:hypothetical protein HK101_007027, partial [Irineochytrium annulatum]